MKKIIFNLEQLSKWYGICVIFLYSILLAEFFSTVNHLFPIDNNIANSNIFIIISKASYIVTIISGIVIWIVITFLFHLTALLFNGHSPFNKFLYVSAYPYIVPAIMILTSIFLLDGIQIPNTEDAINILMSNSSFKLAMNLINYSFIPYYIMIIILIHYIHQIKYLYATLSVVIPIAGIWAISQLFMRIL